MERKERLKGRVVFLMMHKRGEPKSFYIGTSVSEISTKCGMHKMSLTRGARLAEESPDKMYETTNYLICVTDKFGFVRGKTHGGNFAYVR